MKQTFKVSGMTCDGCVTIVHDRLAGISGIKNVTVSLTNELADIESEQPIPADACNAALKGTIYSISAINNGPANTTIENITTEQNKSLAASYITAVAQKDYELIRKCVKNDFKFYGMVNYQSADQFIQMLLEHAANPATDIVVKNDIKALFANDDEVYVIYDLLTKNNMSVPCMESIKIS
ncbi:MAG: heavy-metal-associated domain-containing protein, partial [Flavipsychrobacter sp.]